MFKAARWRSEKNKIKAVFKLELYATKVTKLGWEAAMVSLVPLDVGKPTARSEKATVMDGNCQWRKPMYETVKLIQDPKTGQISNKLYNFIVSATGSARASIIGEATINLSEYAEVSKPSNVSLPLKASDSGPILHVTIQRVQDDVQKRESEENRDAYAREQERKMAGQLNKDDEEDGSKAMKSNDGSPTMFQAKMRFPFSTMMHMVAGYNRNLNSNITDLTATRRSDKSSEHHMPEENGMDNYHNRSFQSPLRRTGSPHKTTSMSVNLVTADYRDHQRSITSLSFTSGPEESSDGSINSLAETGLGERLQESEDPLVGDVALSRHGEVSKLELQTLQRQLVKESKRAQDLARELSRVIEERDALKRDDAEFKDAQKKLGDQTVLSLSHFDGEDPWSIIEEIKQELTHEKKLNVNLRLQLEKTQESNSQLILAVEDLEKVLEQKNIETTCLNCSTAPIKTATSDNLSEVKFRSSDLHIYSCKQELLGTTSEEDSEQYALEELVRGHRDTKEAYSLDQQIIDLNSELELYKRYHEELEMQMEQLALDYEILKQENHDITSKLEQYRLREQLRMQYECSAHSSIISDLETCMKNLKDELEEQSEAFEADLRTLTHAKIQLEQRAIRAEEELRNTRWNNASTAEKLQEEFEKLATQMSSTFQMNEKLATQALSEAGDLRLQKCQLEELLEETNKRMASIQHQYQVKVQGLSDLVTSKTKETDRLLLELKQKTGELHNLNSHMKAREQAISEETQLYKDEVEKLSRKNVVISEELEKKGKLIVELQQLKESTKETEMLLLDTCLERDQLEKELASMREAEKKIVQELHDMRNLKDEKERIIRALTSELATLRAQYNDLKNTSFEDEVEKETLRKQVFHLRGDLHKKEDAITILEKRLKDTNARLETTKATIRNKNGTHSPAPQTSKEVANLREKIKILEGKIKLKDAAMEDTKNSFIMKERDMTNRIEELKKNISEYSAGLSGGTHQEGKDYNKQNRDVPELKCEKSIREKQMSISPSQEAMTVDKLNKVNTDRKISLQPIMEEKASKHNLKGRNKELATRTVGTSLEEIKEHIISTEHSQESLAEMSSKMTALRDKNEAVETELKEMQERYTEISLKFAEVEAERQQLVMTVRTLKNSLKN